MGEGHSGRRWAPVRFPARGRARVPERIVERVAKIYRQQAADTERFRSAIGELTTRLDLSGGVVVGVTCDHRFASLLENWAAGCDLAGIDVRSRALVFATDRAAAERIDGLGLVTYHDEDSDAVAAMSDSECYGDARWIEYMYHQNWVIRSLLGLGHEVLFQDADVVWRRDPVPALREQAAAGADIQAMYDGPNGRFQPLYANSGFMYFGATDRVRTFWDAVYARHDMVGYYASQQEPLNVMLAVEAQRGLTVSILDEERFANGHLYCGDRTAPPDPWVVHHSWTADLDTKLERYVANGHWYLDPPA